MGNIVYAFSQWVILIALARLGTANLVGVFAISVAVITPVFMLTNLQLRAIQVTDARHEYNFSDYLWVRFVGNCIAIAILIAVGLLVSYPALTLATIIIFGIAKSIEALSDVVYGLMQQHDEMGHIAKSMIGKGILSAAAFAASLHFWHSLPLSCVALACTWLLILCTYDLPCAVQILEATPRRVWPIRPNHQAILSLALSALPMGVVLMLASITLNLPRYFLSHYNGERALGIFSILVYFIQIGAMVVSAMCTSVCTRLANHHASLEFALFWTLLRNTALLTSLVGLCGIAAALFGGSLLLSMIYGREYAEYTPHLVGLMIAAFFHYLATCFGTGLTAVRRFSLQLRMQCAILSLAIPICYLGIRQFGLRGAVFATIGTAVVFAAVQACALLWTERATLSPPTLPEALPQIK